MQNIPKFKVTFFLRINKRNSIGEAPIYVRVTVGAIRKDFSLNRWVDPNNWNSQTTSAKGNKEAARTLNEFLQQVKSRLLNIYNHLLSRNVLITFESIRDLFNGKKEERKSLIKIFEYHNSQMEGKVGKGYAIGTYKRYITSLDLTKKFLKDVYKKEDIYLDELKYVFITDFEYYLRTKRNNCHNTAAKYISNFRKIIKIAHFNEWLEKDPFEKHKKTLEEVKREFLIQEEIEAIETKAFSTERLSIARDIFIFSCYTGLAYVDVKKLTHNEIRKGIDGKFWIFTERTKTGTDSDVLLLPKALLLVEKYKNDPEALNKGTVFPIKSNQKMNEYLKEIAAICGIQKHLTFHMARHTFATYMVTNGISLESVSSMMGHKNFKTAQHYAKIIKQKISNEMIELGEKLSKTA
jgi:site-specific recombinase XerD